MGDVLLECILRCALGCMIEGELLCELVCVLEGELLLFLEGGVGTAAAT